MWFSDKLWQVKMSFMILLITAEWNHQLPAWKEMKKAVVVKEITIRLCDNSQSATYTVSSLGALCCWRLLGFPQRPHLCDRQWWKCAGNAALLQIHGNSVNIIVAGGTQDSKSLLFPKWLPKCPQGARSKVLAGHRASSYERQISPLNI